MNREQIDGPGTDKASDEPPLGRRMLGLGVVTCGALLFGCASTQPAPLIRAGSAEVPSDVARLQDCLRQQDQRVAELEARLALLEQESRRQRQLGRSKLQHSVTLGEHPAEAQPDVNPGSETMSAEAQPVADRRPPLRLRLHGTPERDQSRRSGAPPRRPADPLPAVPVVHERLPIAPLPAVAGDKSKAQAASSAFRARYLRALSVLQARKYAKAHDALSVLLTDFPSHRLRDKVLYWRGEAAYALRRYRDALNDFQNLAKRFPQSSKRAEGLYKASLCLRRLGEAASAEALLARVRAEYPESEMAQLSGREGPR